MPFSNTLNRAKAILFPRRITTSANAGGSSSSAATPRQSPFGRLSQTFRRRRAPQRDGTQNSPSNQPSGITLPPYPSSWNHPYPFVLSQEIPEWQSVYSEADDADDWYDEPELSWVPELPYQGHSARQGDVFAVDDTQHEQFFTSAADLRATYARFISFCGTASSRVDPHWPRRSNQRQRDRAQEHQEEVRWLLAAESLIMPVDEARDQARAAFGRAVAFSDPRAHTEGRMGGKWTMASGASSKGKLTPSRSPLSG